MNKVIRKAILITIFAILSVSSVFASKDVITLHLVANVPERNYVNVSDDRINVSTNSDRVSFEAYDENGSLISTDYSFISSSSAVKLQFSAVWLKIESNLLLSFLPREESFSFCGKVCLKPVEIIVDNLYCCGKLYSFWWVLHVFNNTIFYLNRFSTWFSIIFLFILKANIRFSTIQHILLLSLLNIKIHLIMLMKAAKSFPAIKNFCFPL